MSIDSYQEVAKAGRTLMLKEPFYGLFLIGINKELSKGIQTACVAKDNINLKLVVNPEYFEKQDTMTRVAILKHEMLHIAMQHLGMFDQFENKRLLNVAADLEINQYISSELKGPTWEGLDIVDGEFNHDLLYEYTYQVVKNLNVMEVKTKFGTYTMETRNSTKISTDKLAVFIERLKKIGIEVKLSGNFPWIYLSEINGVRVKENFQANHGFTVMFLPGRNDSPPSDFTDIKEIFNLLRKYKKQ